MNRSVWITGVIVAQALWALALGGLDGLLIKAALTEADPWDSLGFEIGAVIVAIPALLVTVSWYGLWKERLWGWWLAFFADVAIVGVLIYEMVDNGVRNIDFPLAAIMSIPSAIISVVLLMPKVRRFFWRSALSQARL